MNYDFVEPSICSKCGYNFDCATDLRVENRPKPGDWSMCFKCGNIAVFDEQLKVRSATQEELLRAIEEPEIAAYIKLYNIFGGYMGYPILIRRMALDHKVLAVARTRVEGKWAAYVGAVCGVNHDDEYEEVLKHGSKLPEHFARVLFTEFEELPYAN